MKSVTIYTDGSCLGNPGPGGWAAILRLEGTAYKKEIFGGYRLTTNNRMEILAVIEALQALKERCRVRIVTDSRYVADAVAKGWLQSWKKRNWRKANNKETLNADLWARLLALLERHEARFEWIRGHAGHAENERCDKLAKNCAQSSDLPADECFERIAGQSNL